MKTNKTHYSLKSSQFQAQKANDEYNIMKCPAKGQLILMFDVLVFSILPKNERKISAPVG